MKRVDGLFLRVFNHPLFSVSVLSLKMIACNHFEAGAYLVLGGCVPQLK